MGFEQGEYYGDVFSGQSSLAPSTKSLHWRITITMSPIERPSQQEVLQNLILDNGLETVDEVGVIP